MDTPTSQLWIHPEKRRYYRVWLSRDLLGMICLHCSWGGLDSARGGEKREVFSDWQKAREKLELVGKQRKQHGYNCIQK
jgi:predicted DNA-binding WGR domain protein